MTREEYLDQFLKVATLKPSGRRALLELGLQLLFLLTGFLLTLQGSWPWLAGQLVLGVSLWRSFALVHACGHHAFSGDHNTDDIVGCFFSLFCFIPYFAWKFIHLEHHKWCGWIDLDPTMRGLEKKRHPAILSLLNLAWWCWIPVISVHYIASIFFRVDLHEYRKQPLVLFSVLLVLAFHGVFLGVAPLLWLRCFGVAGFFYLTLGDLSLLSQHVHIPQDHSRGEAVQPKKSYEQADYSHTMVLPGFVSKWIVMRFNHHALHHVYPQLPYYLEPELPYVGKYAQDWKSWILSAKRSRASELIFPPTEVSITSGSPLSS